MNAHAPVHLALDAHGGDHGPAVTVPAAIDALRADPELRLTLVGIPSSLAPFLDGQAPAHRARLELHAADDVLEADARPVSILRSGEGTSLYSALELVSLGRSDACVSAGSTVALVTLGVKLLGTLPGIRRPALMAQIPSAGGATGMLDLGANLNVTAVQLVQFAIMGTVVRAGQGGASASVGLLNVGHEDGKGNTVVREAHERLRATALDYRGFIEGHDIFEGKVDVAVCDGFAGNLILKSSEGLAGMLFEEVRRTLDSSWRARLGGRLAQPALRAMVERLNPAKHNGAPLLGLNGVVVKSHGRADRYALCQAILEAGREVRRKVPGKIEDMIRNYKAEAES